LVLVACWALLLTGYSASVNAQTDSTTGNLINYGTSATDTTSTWNNGVYVNSLTCWSPGGPGNCGPNPSVLPSGQIHFSYGQVDLNQVVNINRALAAGGTGVQLSGFNFAFTAKNGNGWDDGRQDYLAAYVKLYGSTGSQVASYDYTAQTNQRYNWRQFNFSETFATPYTASTLGNAQVGFVGRDNNFWAGPYGPEIINVNFSLKYTVKPDPCIADPLSSPTCPGYALATVKNSILGSTVSNASVTSYIPSTNYTSPAPAVLGIAEANPALAQASPQQQAQQPAPQQPAPAQGQDPNQNPSVAQDNPAQPSPQQAGPAPTSPQPAGGPPQTATASAPLSSSGPSQAGPQQGGGGSGPSKLAMSVLKTAQANDKATQAAAVQQAAKAFENTQQSSQTASNLAISMNQDMSANSAVSAAAFASQSTQASQQTATQTGQSSQQTQQVNSVQQQQNTRVVQQAQQTQQEVQTTQQASSNLVQLQPPQQVVQQVETQTVATVVKTPTPQQEVQQAQTQSNGSVVQIQQAAYTPPAQQQQETPSTAVAMLKPTPPAPAEVQSQPSSGTGLVPSRNLFAYNPLGSINMANMSSAPTQTAPVYQPRIQERVMEVEAPQVQMASFGGAGRAGNPLSEIMMQQRFETMQENIQPQLSTVNRNVQPNDLAGGVDLASMALQPKGFEAYSFTLRDAAFYEPKEVYKGQTVVDNVRALRQMSSDRLHKEMVDQQYK